MFHLQLGYAKHYQCTCISLCITNSLKLAFQFGISAWSTSKRNPGRGFWVNFCKKCGDCDECGENKYFTAFLTKIHCQTSNRETIGLRDLVSLGKINGILTDDTGTNMNAWLIVCF